MSAAAPTEHDAVGTDDRTDLTVAPTPVEVRRNAGLAALIGAAASAIAIAYLWRATHTGAVLDVALCLVMAAVAVVYLVGLVDAKTPLVVADDLGVRIRLGNQWRGLPWEAVREVGVRPRRGLLRDGRLVFAPHSAGRALDGLDTRGRRHAVLNTKMYGAPLAVPVGLTTRVAHAEGSLVEQLEALARGRTEVTLLEPEPREKAAKPAREKPEKPEKAAKAEKPAKQPKQSAGASADEATDVVEDAPAPEPALDREVAPEPEATTDHEAAPVRVTFPHPRTDGPRPPRVQMDTNGAPEDEDATVPVHGDGPAADTAPARPRRNLIGDLGLVVSRFVKDRTRPVEPDGDAEAPLEDSVDAPAEATDEPVRPAATVAPLRDPRRGLRAEITRDAPANLLGAAALADDPQDREGRTGLPEGRELRRPGSVDLVEPAPYEGRVRPISQLGEAVAPLVIDDFVTEPAYDPVIGPELAAARRRVGLTVDELADRTRIRPHVIESIEVDDFAPCGGDFYARGHLRTLARVLGKDVTPLLEQFDARYATAPINARRVFEAELATGMTGSMRGTTGGPNWSLLIGVVLSLLLVWGVVRLFVAQPPEQLTPPAPVLNGSAGAGRGLAGDGPVRAEGSPVKVALHAGSRPTRVVVRDADGKVVFAGPLAAGRDALVSVLPPVHVQAADGGDVTVRVNGERRGPVGQPGHPATRTLHR